MPDAQPKSVSPVVAQLKDMLQLGRERVNQPLPLQSMAP